MQSMASYVSQKKLSNLHKAVSRTLAVGSTRTSAKRGDMTFPRSGLATAAPASAISARIDFIVFLKEEEEEHKRKKKK